VLDDQLDKLHTLIGRIATEFSSVEGLWYLIFTCLLPATPRPAVDAIFNKIRSGRQQRELVLSVSETALADQPDLLKSIRTHVARTDLAAERRNSAIHSIIHVAHFYVVPPMIAARGISKRSKLADKDIAAEIADLYRTVATLELDVQRVRLDAIQFADPTAHPRLLGERQHLESIRLSALGKFETDPILRAVEGRP
jgi:hypothetical protein